MTEVVGGLGDTWSLTAPTPWATWYGHVVVWMYKMWMTCSIVDNVRGFRG